MRRVGPGAWPASELPEGLARKLNVLRGLDTAMHIGHNRGGVLGNFADTNGQGRLGLSDRPTIDQIMAWSPAFYRDLQNVRLRSMSYGPSWGYSNGNAQSGAVQKVSTGLDSRTLFARIFSSTPQTPQVSRKPIVDRECGMDTHWQVSIPVVTAGAAGGTLKTGLYVDYRNRSSSQVITLSGDMPAVDRVQRHGLLYNQFLATALQAVGVPRNDFERWWALRAVGLRRFGWRHRQLQGERVKL